MGLEDIVLLLGQARLDIDCESGEMMRKGRSRWRVVHVMGVYADRLLPKMRIPQVYPQVLVVGVHSVVGEFHDDRQTNAS